MDCCGNYAQDHGALSSRTAARSIATGLDGHTVRHGDRETLDNIARTRAGSVAGSSRRSSSPREPELV
jgi:hypothetical protein